MIFLFCSHNYLSVLIIFSDITYYLPRHLIFNLNLKFKSEEAPHFAAPDLILPVEKILFQMQMLQSEPSSEK